MLEQTINDPYEKGEGLTEDGLLLFYQQYLKKITQNL